MISYPLRCKLGPQQCSDGSHPERKSVKRHCLPSKVDYLSSSRLVLPSDSKGVQAPWTHPPCRRSGSWLESPSPTSEKYMCQMAILATFQRKSLILGWVTTFYIQVASILLLGPALLISVRSLTWILGQHDRPRTLRSRLQWIGIEMAIILSMSWLPKKWVMSYALQPLPSSVIRSQTHRWLSTSILM